MFKAYFTIGAGLAAYITGSAMSSSHETQNKIFNRELHGVDKAGVLTGMFAATLVAWPIVVVKAVKRTADHYTGLVT